jgi:brefeldin A-inhibited guanine nucleotide-exchange protein
MAKNENIKSGWKTLFSILNRAAKDPNDAIVTMSFDTIKALHTNENFLDQIYLLISTSPSGQAGGSSATFSFFPDYVACLVEFARNKLSARISLQAVEIVRVTVDKLSVKINSAPSKISETNAAKEIEAEEISEVPLKNSDSLDSSLSELADYQNIPDGSSQKTPIGDPIMKFWFPVCFGLYEIVMTCDLEVRTKALKLLFNLLKTHGETFTKEFWDVLARGVLFPLFDDLKLTRSEKRKFENKEDMMVWLNTTLIEALRQLFDLFTYMFSVLEGLLLDGLLDLIKVCFNNQQGKFSLDYLSFA